MQFGSDCSGSCNECVCHYLGGCLAGHGDDDYQRPTKDQAAKWLAAGGKQVFVKWTDEEIRSLRAISGTDHKTGEEMRDALAANVKSDGEFIGRWVDAIKALQERGASDEVIAALADAGPCELSMRAIEAALTEEWC